MLFLLERDFAMNIKMRTGMAYFIKRVNLVITCILITVLSVACNQGGFQSANELVAINRYQAISEEATQNINIATIKSWVKNLESDNLSTRTLAISNLKKEIGLDFGYDPVTRRQFPWNRWEEYPKNLEVAIDTKIPKLLEKRTWRNKNHRAWAAMFLGESAPHPAFLPLLRKVITNNQEDQYTRGQALTALTQIPHEGMIEFLIEQLNNNGIALKMKAWEQLQRLTRAKIQLITKSPSWHDVNWQDAQRQYEQWWRTNKAVYAYKREYVMREN